MLSTLLGNDEGVAPLKRLIAEKTEGDPLFMEEIYQALIEEGVLVRNGAVRITRPLNALKIPTTVQAILAARIDRLPSEQKDLLETVAVIGKDFRLPIVSKVVARPQEELEETLAQLQLAEFIYERPAAGDMEYRFKHQLTREAAYNSVLVERRKALHERVARAIEELNANTLDDHLADLAHHYERSGNRVKAVDYLTRAGIQIAQRSASPEAMHQFERALRILKEMPAGRSRDSLELQLQMVIGGNAYRYQGDGSADAGRALARAVELASAPEDSGQKVLALSSLAGHHLARAEVQRASEVLRNLYELVGETRNPEFESIANQIIGHAAMQMGEFHKAEKVLRAVAEGASGARVGIRGYALARRGSALWCLGFPDQALALTREAVMLGEDADDRHAYPTVLFWSALTHMRCGELTRADDLFRRSLDLSIERGFPVIRALTATFMGLVSVLRGEALAGLEQVHRGIELFPASWLPFPQQRQRYGYYLALGLASAGRPDEAFSTLLPTIDWTEQCGLEVELALMHLLKGRLFEDKCNSKDAEKSFRTSIEIARRQSAKSFELRATTSLARLLRDTNRPNEARAMLAEIYNWFTEGFDTADLKDARALLEQLNG